MKENIEAIWLKLADDLKAFIISRVRDEAITDDILQEVFIKIHSKIDSLNDETKLQSWIYQITRNQIIDHFRKEKKNQQQIVFPLEHDEEPESDHFMQESIQDMINMMDKLPEEYCEALCMTELEGISQKEYAEKVGISYSGAKSRVQRARKMLRDMLMKCCHYQFDKYGTVIGIYPANCCCCSS